VHQGHHLLHQSESVLSDIRHNSVSVSNFLRGNRFRCSFLTFHFRFSTLASTTDRNDANFYIIQNYVIKIDLHFLPNKFIQGLPPI
jgi:hypothetical protein